MANTKEVIITVLVPYNWASELTPEEGQLMAAWFLAPSGLRLTYPGHHEYLPLPNGGQLSMGTLYIRGVEAIWHATLRKILAVFERQRYVQITEAYVRDIDNGTGFEPIQSIKTPITAMVAGGRYEIRYRNPQHRRDRLDVMDYLGDDYRSHPQGAYVFSARPIAGTQNLPMDWVSSLKRVDKSTPIRINRIAR